MAHGREVVGTWNLLTGENTYASQTAQSPSTSRRVKSWLPELDGALHRELAEPLYVSTSLTNPVVALFNFNQNNSNGVVTRYYFAAARTVSDDSARTCLLYQQIGLIWSQVTAVGTLSDTPVFRVLNNLLFMVDGDNNWLFDGVNWVHTGISIPYQGGFNAQNQFSGPPFWQPAIDTTAVGVFNPAVGRYYWFTMSDQTSTRPVHEGDSSAISVITGPLVNKKVAVYQTPGLWSVTTGSKEITVAVSADNPGPTKPLASVSPDPGSGPAILAGAFNGLTLYINGTLIGVIGGVGTNGGGDNVLVLVANSASTIVAGRAVLVDARCTHWNIYASEADGSKVGQFLNVSVPVTQNLTTTPQYDETPFIDDATTTIVSTFRPVRNDPPPPSKILETHKSRLWRVRTAKPNLFDFTANEEVEAGNNGNPSECVPGAEESFTAAAGNEITSQKIAGAGANQTTGGSEVAWTNPNNVTSAVSYATCALTGAKVTKYLVCSNFGFALPTGAQVLGIKVTFDALCSTGGKQMFIGLVKGGTILASGESESIASVADTYNHGSDMFLWGNTWLDTDINAATFGCYFLAGNSSPDLTWSMKNVKITVYYITGVTDSEEVANTISDLVNEVSFPDQSNRIRGLQSHADALYMFSERQCYPLYGESIDDFALSQVTAFSCGIAGRFASKSTPHGMPFVTYDRKVMLFPSSGTPRTNVTSVLQEIGLALRNKLLAIDTRFLDDVVTEFYFFNKRDWFVLAFRDTSEVYHTWVYDFGTQGWFELQRGFSSLAVFEIGDGSLILVGGGTNGSVYVIDDLSGTFTSTDDLPEANWRPALIDFGDPDNMRLVQRIELEVSSNAMMDGIAVTFWLDPEDVDNPGTGRTITMSRIKGSNRYAGWLTDGGSVCQRLLVDITTAAGGTAGTIRGIKLVAQKVRGILANPEGLSGDAT